MGIEFEKALAKSGYSAIKCVFSTVVFVRLVTVSRVDEGPQRTRRDAWVILISQFFLPSLIRLSRENKKKKKIILRDILVP